MTPFMAKRSSLAIKKEPNEPNVFILGTEHSITERKCLVFENRTCLGMGDLWKAPKSERSDFSALLYTYLRSIPKGWQPLEK